MWKIKTTTTVSNAVGCKCGVIGIWAGKSDIFLHLIHIFGICSQILMNFAAIVFYVLYPYELNKSVEVI